MFNNGKSRLDFFLVSPLFLDKISSVKYGGRLGADFDHKEVLLTLGKKSRGFKITIHDSTLWDVSADTAGTLACYEAILDHLTVPDAELRDNVIQLDLLVREQALVETLIAEAGEDPTWLERRTTVNANIEITINRLTDIDTLLQQQYNCPKKLLYEMAINNIKNRLIAVQRDRIRRLGAKRELILNRIEYMTRKFGDDSVQAIEERDKLLRHDDVNLKDRAIKFKEFLDGNNEKITKAFCKLSKEGGLCDNMTQICGDNGKTFNKDSDRQKHIREFMQHYTRKKWTDFYR